MALPEIRSFGPDDADEVQAAVDLGNLVDDADSPWVRPGLLEQLVASLRHGWDGEPATPYLMTHEGRVVALGEVSLTERENRHLAWLGVKVHPELRRRGYGTLLWRRLVEEARAAGRTSVATDGWEGDACVQFARSVGLEQKATEIMRRQHLAELAPGTAERLVERAQERATDYELIRIAGRTPPELVEAVAELSAAINDAPTDDLDIEDDVMSVERIAAYEASVEARGHRLYRLLARHRGTGELGGHTVVAVETARPGLAHQHDTAVARAHRGHRLGLLLKAGMVLWLAEAEPQVETVDTWNAESNGFMIGVNEDLGYRVMGRALEFQAPIGAGAGPQEA